VFLIRDPDPDAGSSRTAFHAVAHPTFRNWVLLWPPLLSPALTSLLPLNYYHRHQRGVDDGALQHLPGLNVSSLRKLILVEYDLDSSLGA
jgi:hypothetical protein